MDESEGMMDDDWAMELAAAAGGLDPHNPCPKCGTVPSAPGDGSGRSCPQCGWTWMVGVDGGRYRPLVRVPYAHEALVLEAARRFRWQVEDAAALADGRARQTLRAVARALEQGVSDPDKVRLSGRLLDQRTWEEVHAEPRLRSMLVNQYCLGLGSSQAPVLVMGTEAADDLNDPMELAYQSLFPLVLLTDGRGNITDRLLQFGGWSRSTAPWPLHQAPWDFFTPKPRAPRTTWKLVCDVVSAAPPEQLIGRDRAGLGLGARAYQIERSATSALKARNGSPPSAERVDFLTTTFFPAVADTARVLLMHGFGRPWPVWKERSSRIAMAFLGRSPRLDWQHTHDNSSDLVIERAADGRTFIWCRALNFNVSGALIEDVRSAILEAAPETS